MDPGRPSRNAGGRASEFTGSCEFVPEHDIARRAEQSPRHPKIIRWSAPQTTSSSLEPAPNTGRPAGERHVRPGCREPEHEATGNRVRAEPAESGLAGDDRAERPIAGLSFPGGPGVGLERLFLAVLQR